METITFKRWRWGVASGILCLHVAFANISLTRVTQQVNHALAHTTPVKWLAATPSSAKTANTPSTATAPLALVFFFLSTCPHCQRFAPIVKQYAATHHQKLYAFSLDGGALPLFPHPLPATPPIRQTFLGQGPVVAPMVFLINVKTLQMIDVAQGEESAVQFSQAVRLASTQLLSASTPMRRMP